MGHGAAERARRRPWETQSVFAMPADGRAGRRHGSASVEDHPDASGDPYPLQENNIFRQIFLDGRPLPKDPDPRWMGYSVGRWEGDALVVESSGFREGGWLDRMGHPHSSDLHLIERFRRLDVGHLEIDVTIEDPKAYGKRFTYTLQQTLIPDQDLYEYFCTENEKDVEHFK